MPDEKPKICPLMSGRGIDQTVCRCHKELCAFWVTGYTTEAIQVSCCAIEFMALKNSEGQYRV